MARGRGLSDVAGIRLRAPQGDGPHNHNYVGGEVDEGAAGLSRDVLMTVLHHENVLARRYFFPGCHRMEPHRSQRKEMPLPVTDQVAQRSLARPTGTAVNVDDIETVCTLVRGALAHFESFGAGGSAPSRPGTLFVYS